jgi:hypothetical protein
MRLIPKDVFHLLKPLRFVELSEEVLWEHRLTSNRLPGRLALM